MHDVDFVVSTTQVQNLIFIGKYHTIDVRLLEAISVKKNSDIKLFHTEKFIQIFVMKSKGISLPVGRNLHGPWCSGLWSFVRQNYVPIPSSNFTRCTSDEKIVSGEHTLYLRIGMCWETVSRPGQFIVIVRLSRTEHFWQTSKTSIEKLWHEIWENKNIQVD